MEYAHHIVSETLLTGGTHNYSDPFTFSHGILWQMDSLRLPNFPLVADILYWLIHR